MQTTASRFPLNMYGVVTKSGCQYGRGLAMDGSMFGRRGDGKAGPLPGESTYVLCSGGMFKTVSGAYGGPGRKDVAVYATVAAASADKGAMDHVVGSAVFGLDDREANAGT